MVVLVLVEMVEVVECSLTETSLKVEDLKAKMQMKRTQLKVEEVGE